MARKEDKELTEEIVKVLRKYPEGTYISEIAREVNKQKSTIAYVINTRLKDKIVEIKVGQKGLFRLIRLKQSN